MRIEQEHHSRIVVALRMLVFLVSATFGFIVFSEIGATSYYREERGGTEPNLLGFILTIALFVLPAVGLTGKLFRIEVAE